jgi:hypothetical protein
VPADQLLEPAELHQHIAQDSRCWGAGGNQCQAQFGQGLGCGEGLEPLAQLAVVVQCLELAHPLQAAAPAHLQPEMGQGHGSSQAAFGPTSSGYGKPQQALLIRQQGEEAVVFPQGFAA